jgi:hypothetical protein
MAEEAGKPVLPLVVPTDDPATALARIARAIGARELWMGPGRWRRPEKLIDRIARAWSAAAAGEGNSTPLTVRIVGEGQDVRRELSPPPDRPVTEFGRGWGGVRLHQRWVMTARGAGDESRLQRVSGSDPVPRLSHFRQGVASISGFSSPERRAPALAELPPLRSGLVVTTSGGGSESDSHIQVVGTVTGSGGSLGAALCQ